MVLDTGMWMFSHFSLNFSHFQLIRPLTLYSTSEAQVQAALKIFPLCFFILLKLEFLASDWLKI